MYTLNGFVNIAPFAINTKGVTAPIGEISVRSLTFSREVGQYKQTDYKDVVLLSFLSAEGDAEIVVPAAIATQVLKFTQWLYNRTVAGNASSDRDQVLEDLLNGFQAEANSFDCGLIKFTPDNRYSLPEWVSWKNNAHDAGDNFVKIYLSDATFQAQYDKYHITPVFPFVPVDDFFLAPAVVKEKLLGRSNEDLSLQIEAAKEGNPETILWGSSFDYVSPLDGSKTSANFNALIYGAAGNTIDNVKEALTSTILANSTHTREEWIKILPDLFKRTEFIMAPIFDRYALPDRQQLSGVYSPVSLLSRALSIAKQMCVGYLPYHVEQNVETMGLTYKSLACVVVGGPENRDEKFRISEIFPDYICVGSGSTDYGRMSKVTTDWLYMIAEMLIVAEYMTAYSDVPRGMTRLVRDNVMYVVKSYNKIQYLIVAKINFLTP